MGGLLDADVALALAIGFVAFSLTASGVYVVNDIKDVEKDRAHELKRARPVASGRVGIPIAWGIAACCALIGFVSPFAFLGAPRAVSAVGMQFIYLVLNLSYSFGLKNRPVIDVFILASGFVLRVLYGSAVSGIAVSSWLLLTVLAFSLYMGLGKRRNELRKSGDDSTRGVLAFYTDEYLGRIMVVAMSVGLTFYSLWAAIASPAGDAMIWTIPIVFAVLMKYELDIAQGGYGDPVDVLTNDKTMCALVAAYAAIIMAVLYVG